MKRYINYYTSIGCDLVNWSDGGEGLTYGNQTSFKKNHGAKKIIAIAKDGSIFKEFESSAKAQEYFDRVGCGGVYMVLKKKRRFYMGYNYLFLDEYNSMSDEDFKKHLDWINNYTQTTEWRREQGKKTGFKKGNKPWDGAIKNLIPYAGKKICQYSKSDEFIKIWDNIITAQRELNIFAICMCIKGKRKTAGGYKWRYYEE